MGNTVSIGKRGFIDMHGLWTDEQKEAAERMKATIIEQDIRLIRVAWADQHGISRAKALTVNGFLGVLESGLEFNTGPLFFDSGSDIVFNPFMEGGGFDLEEMNGCPNYRLVPDPLTFKILPWAPNTAWVLTDAYLKNGKPLPFDSRGILRKAVDEFREAGFEFISGIEVEWTLTKVEDERLHPELLGSPGFPAETPLVKPTARGYQYHLEAHLDEMNEIIHIIADNLQKLGLPLSTIEDEWGPSQLEFTFSPMSGLEAADAMLLFRTAVKQICKRHGYIASFMCRPQLPGFFSSGWHLHQSIKCLETGENLLNPKDGEGVISEIGKQYIGGLLKHARAASVFTTPTVNGYKRLKPNSLAPDRAGWGDDNRGTMIRVIGSPGEGNTRFENRIGEPAANPYLYLASQVMAGLEGIQTKCDPGFPSREAYNEDREPLPLNLMEAVEALKNDSLYSSKMGELFINYIVRMKENEYTRYERFVQNHNIENPNDIVTEWEQKEYFEIF